MTSISKYKQALMATALLALASPTWAQNEAVTEQAGEVAEQANALAAETNELRAVVAEDANMAVEDAATDTSNEDNDRDDDSGKWGLLGLLGLAGLLGLKRRDEDEHHGTTNRDRTGTGPRSGTDSDRAM